MRSCYLHGRCGGGKEGEGGAANGYKVLMRKKNSHCGDNDVQRKVNTVRDLRLYINHTDDLPDTK